MRNHITHVYFGIDLEIVWDTATRWIPDLLARLPAVRAAACEELHVDR
ncbi:HepT-like ribonuclease domain-containing protein [Roseateles sp. So40a]